MIQTWQCQTCGAECQRAAARGQRPKYCARSDCRPKTMSDRLCERCGDPLRSDYRRYCSQACRHPSEPRQARLTRRDRATAKAALMAHGTASAVAWAAGPCGGCGRPFIARAWGKSTARCCSDLCLEHHRRSGKRIGKQRRRAVQRNAFVANVSPRKVFERDRWKCHLCKRKVRRSAVVPHPLAPTIDHVIPLAKGGTHEPANCATAHFQCNVTKSAGGAGEQLALIG